MFRAFQSQGPADLTLAYLTAFIAEVLRFFAKQKTKEEAKKKLTELSMSQNFPIPGQRQNNRAEERMHECDGSGSAPPQACASMDAAMEQRWNTVADVRAAREG